MRNHRGARKRGLRIINVRLFIVTANARLQPFGVLRLNFFLTIEQRLDCAFVFLGLVRIKRVLNSAQRDVKRHAAFFPAFDERPIHRTKHEMLAATANESVFDFGEVREVIQVWGLECGVWSLLLYDLVGKHKGLQTPDSRLRTFCCRS